MGWDDVPHLSDQAKAELISAYPPNERDARTKGIPSLGAGAVYPVPESEILCDPFVIPDWMKQCYALDVGWNRTAVLWGAHDVDSDTVYLYAEHYRGHAEPFEHAQAIIARGAWIPGVIDPAARGRGQKDGEQLLRIYQELLPNLSVANNAVEAGVYAVWVRLSTGRLKVFKTLQHFLSEYRTYQRDEKGQIVKKDDHLMDCCFTAETPVWTKNGPVPIKSLVGKSGLVFSRSGAWAHHLGATLTRHDAEIVKVEFSDGTSVCCTSDHRFLSTRGWVRADKLEGMLCYNGVSQRVWIDQCLQSFRRPVRNLKELATICAESIFSGMEYGFTALFGKVPTVRFPTASTYTTRTTTELTTNSTTLNFSQGRSTQATTKKAIRDLYRKQLWMPPQYGMAPKRDFSGITSIIGMWRTGFMSKASSSASNVGANLSPTSETISDSAPMLARRGIAFNLALTMKNALAWFAAACLWQIATLKRKRVAESAAVFCSRVQSSGKADVYCLKVPAVEAFCVGSGIVVHNCRYLILSGLDIATVRPPAQWTTGAQKQGLVYEYNPYSPTER